MTGYTRSGKTTVAPEVLINIARMAALEVAGVKHMAPVPGGVNRLFRRGASDGVQLEVADGVVTVDLYVVLDHDVNIRDTSRIIQLQVARSISEMMGMEVGSINIHIEDISYEGKNEA